MQRCDGATVVLARLTPAYGAYGAAAAYLCFLLTVAASVQGAALCW